MNLRRYVLFLLPLLAACSESATASRKAVIAEYTQHGTLVAFAQFVRSATRGQRVPVVYFYADWCGPCRRFRAALSSDPVDEAPQQTTLIKVNVDSCQELAAYYNVTAVPTFMKVDAEGQAVATITSAELGEDVPAEIAPVMAKLVNSQTYDLKK